MCSVAQSYPTLWDPMDSSPTRLLTAMNLFMALVYQQVHVVRCACGDDSRPDFTCSRGQFTPIHLPLPSPLCWYPVIHTILAERLLPAALKQAVWSHVHPVSLLHKPPQAPQLKFSISFSYDMGINMGIMDSTHKPYVR